MSIENLVVTLNRVPKIDATVSSGVDWVAICSFFATIAVVIAGAIYNAYVLKRTLSTQKTIAEASVRNMRELSKAEAVARSRQEWINSLRSDIASFLAVGNDLRAVSEKLLNPSPVVAGTQEHVLRAQDLYDRLYSELSSSLTTARLHFAKVQLYTNPTEEETISLIKAMNAYIQAAMAGQPTADLGNSVVQVGQKIIKNEWIRVRDMSL